MAAKEKPVARLRKKTREKLMPGVRLTPEQADAANSLLMEIQERLERMSGDNVELLFSLRRRIFIRPSYAERGAPGATEKT